MLTLPDYPIRQRDFLLEISRAITAQLDLKEVLKRVLNASMVMTAAKVGLIGLHNDQDNIFEVHAYTGIKPEIIPKVHDWLQQTMTIAGDTNDLNEGLQELAKFIDTDLKQSIAMPLTFDKKLVGILIVFRTYQTETTRDDLAMLNGFADQAAISVQNARVFKQVQETATQLEYIVQERTQELEEERDRLDKLYQITSELARTLDMEQLLERSLDIVSKAVGANDGVMFLLDPLTERLYPRAWIDKSNLFYVEKEDVYTHPAANIAEWLIRLDADDNIVIVNDLNGQEYWDKQGAATGLQSALAVKLENNEDLMGVMVLLSEKVSIFTQNHLRLLAPAATQISASINRVDMYQLIRDQSERMGKLLRSEQEEAQTNAAIVESIGDGVMLINAKGEIVLFNTAAERILELPSNQAIGKPVNQVISIYGNSGLKWMNLINRWSGISQDIMDNEIASERLELGRKIIQASLSPVYIGDLYLGTVSIFRDITQSEKMLREQLSFAERSASILESLEDGVIFVDTNGDVSVYNSRAESLLRIRRDKIIGKNLNYIGDVYDETKNWAHPIARWTETPEAYKTEQQGSFEAEVNSMRLHFSLNPVHMGSEYLGSVTILRDLT